MFLVPDQQTLKALLHREHVLQHCELVQRAFSLSCLDRYAVLSHIQHQVVREFGLPDSAVELLQSARLYTVNSCPEEEGMTQTQPEMSHVFHGTVTGTHFLHQHSTPSRQFRAHTSPPQSPRNLMAPHSHPGLLANKGPGLYHKVTHVSRTVSCPAGHDTTRERCGNFPPPTQHQHSCHPSSACTKMCYYQQQPTYIAPSCVHTGNPQVAQMGNPTYVHGTSHDSGIGSQVLHAACAQPRSPAMSPACRKICQVSKM